MRSAAQPAPADSDEGPLIEACALSLHAGGRWLVRNLDWGARRGERWCVIGRNAVGKSTLLRALAGIGATERSGQVRWFGRPQSQWAAADAASARAFVAQHLSDRFPISVKRLLDLSVVVPTGLDAGEVLDQLDAGALAQRNVMQLSGGERQRVALAQCRLQGAAVMLMDEPVAFQDPAHQMQVAQWLTWQRESCVVVTAHDVNWIAGTATHVLALFGDGSWEQGTRAQMLQADRLRRIYGCAWRESDGAWVAEPGSQ